MIHTARQQAPLKEDSAKSCLACPPVRWSRTGHARLIRLDQSPLQRDQISVWLSSPSLLAIEVRASPRNSDRRAWPRDIWDRRRCGLFPGTATCARRCEIERCRILRSRLCPRWRASIGLCTISGTGSLCRFDGRSHARLHQSVLGRVPRNLEWTDQARGPANASIAFPQRLRRLFSPAAKKRHSSRGKKAG
jgi:hypothetical protein